MISTEENTVGILDMNTAMKMRELGKAYTKQVAQVLKADPNAAGVDKETVDYNILLNAVWYAIDGCISEGVVINGHIYKTLVNDIYEEFMAKAAEKAMKRAMQ